MNGDELLTHWEQCVSAVDIVKLYRQMGGQLSRNKYGKCTRCGNETLYFNKDWHSFRCLNLLCNDHGDVVSLIQRSGGLSFREAFAILDGGRYSQRWSPNELERFGAVRDCMTAAAVLCARHLHYVEQYVNQRGIPTNLAQQFLVGAAWEKELLKNHLIDKGFPLEIVRLAGLLSEDDQNRFDTHVVIPLRQYGQVFDFYARYVGDDPVVGKEGFLPSARLTVGRGYFNWNPDREQIVCVEGILDALSLFQNGYENAVATGCHTSFNPELLQGTKIARVWFCVTTDAAHRARVRGAAHACAETGVDVRIIELPDGFNPEEFFLTHSAADFTLLVVNSKTLEQWPVDRAGD